MKLKEIENTVILAPDRETCEKLLIILEKAGHKGIAGNSPTKIDLWAHWREETCVRPSNPISYGKRQYYKQNHVNRMTFKDYLKIQNSAA